MVLRLTFFLLEQPQQRQQQQQPGQPHAQSGFAPVFQAQPGVVGLSEVPFVAHATQPPGSLPGEGKKKRNRNRHKRGPRVPGGAGAHDDDDDDDETGMALDAPPSGASAAAAAAPAGGSGGQDKPSHITDVPFASLPLTPATMRGVCESAGYQFMTKVQHESIPHALGGHDLLARAKTGTGKTCAFLVPGIERIVAARLPRLGMLILSPTRELATQIATEARKLLKFHPALRVAIVMGGTNMSKEQRQLAQGVDILVATPGRFLDHLKSTPGVAERRVFIFF